MISIPCVVRPASRSFNSGPRRPCCPGNCQYKSKRESQQIRSLKAHQRCKKSDRQCPVSGFCGTVSIESSYFGRKVFVRGFFYPTAGFIYAVVCHLVLSASIENNLLSSHSICISYPYLYLRLCGCTCRWANSLVCDQIRAQRSENKQIVAHYGLLSSHDFVQNDWKSYAPTRKAQK